MLMNRDTRLEEPRPPAAVPGTPPARHDSRGRILAEQDVRGHGVGKLEEPKTANRALPSRARQPRRRVTTAHDIALDAVDADAPSRPSPGQGQHGKTVA